MFALLLGSTLALAAPEVVDDPPPRFRGVGMFVGSFAFGVTGLGFKLVSTVNDPRQARELDRGGFCIDFCYVGGIFDSVSAPFWVSSIGMLGGAMHMRARWLAYWDVEDGIDRSRRARVATATGWSLFGAGVVAFIALQASRAAAGNAITSIALRESAWWSGLAMAYPGAALIGWGGGYRSGRSDRKVMVTPNLTGLTLSGRF